MKRDAANQARRIIDGNLKGFGVGLQTPRDGWIRSIREALGMTRQQLGARMESSRFSKQGVSASAVQALERQEPTGAITLDSLERAARAMDCHLVYAIVPNTSLQDTVDRQATHVARMVGAQVERTMLLESQGASLGAESFAADSLVGTPALWR